jgi:hypothetical protein
MKKWKKGLRRWLRFSLLMARMKTLREVFVIQPVLRKTLSQILKIRLHFPRIASGKRNVEQGKRVKFGKKRFFFGKAVFRIPLRW